MNLIHSILYEQKESTQTALICPELDISLTYAELFDQCLKLSRVLRRIGLQPQDRVAILLPNSAEFANAIFATLHAGAIAIPLDIYAKRNEILAIFDVIRPAFVITNQDLFRKVKADLPSGVKACLLDLSEEQLAVQYNLADPTPDVAELELFKPAANGHNGHHPRWAAIEPEDDAFFIMTSGSTGRPKAVRLSHRAVLNNIRMHLNSLRLDEKLVGLQVLPMNYSYGLIASFLSILYRGGTAVVMSRFDESLVARYIDRYQVNFFMGTPTIFRHFLESVRQDGSRLESLRHITLGGDKYHPYLARLIQETLPQVNVYVTYGLSEAGPRVSTLPPEYFPALRHSIGLPLDGVELVIINEQGQICLPYETGEIVVKTPSLMSGYFGNQEETAKVLRDGWCYTGDLGHMDENGFIFFAGRKNRVFKINGKKVNPAFIEDCIAAHPLVQEARVRKVDEQKDEYLQARIKVNGLAPDDLETELKKHCRKKMSSYMIPRDFRIDETVAFSLKTKL